MREVKKLDGACTLQLRLLSKSRYHEGFWNFLERYGYRYGVEHRRTLLPCEVVIFYLFMLEFGFWKFLKRYGYRYNIEDR